MRWIRSHFYLLLIYGVFAGTGGHWIIQWQKFRGVETWPSTEARIIQSGSVALPYQYDGRDGYHRGSENAGHVTFEYSVGVRTYQSGRATPDGGGLPVAAPDEKWKAHYQPDSPDLAVLYPVPYHGTGWLIAACLCAILIGVHLFLELPVLIARRGWRTGSGKEF